MLIPLATLPAQPRYCRCTPAVAVPVFSWPVSSSAPITRPRRRPPRRAASSRPATANRRTTPIAANVSHDARLSSRCVRSGARSPACSAIVQPLRFGSPLTSALTYLPACSHGSVRAKHGLSRHQQLPALPGAQPRPYPGSRSRLRFCCPHKLHDREAAASYRNQGPTPASPALPQLKPRMAAALLVCAWNILVCAWNMITEPIWWVFGASSPTYC